MLRAWPLDPKLMPAGDRAEFSGPPKVLIQYSQLIKSLQVWDWQAT